MTTQELIERLVPILNRQVDLPLVGEDTEAALLTSALQAVVPAIPEEARPFLLDASDGLSDEERDRYSKATLDSALHALFRQVPVFLRPFVEDAARNVLSPLIDAVFRFAQQGLSVLEPDSES